MAIFLFAIHTINAQKRNTIWCFGDSAGIDFSNVNNPTTFQSGNDTRGSNCAIADSNGNLLFYASTSYKPFYLMGLAWMGAIYNKNHQLMLHADTLIARTWFNEVVIIPFPNNDSMYYVFFAGVTSIYGLYYCVVNMKGDGGLGEVVSKNNQLQPFAQVDCLNAIKHGNGRDWWLFFRRYDPNGLPPNNEFHSYLISPAGITNYTIQNVGSMQTTGGGKITFSKKGDILVYSDWRWLIEKYDFDRCTGVISNPLNIQQENTVNYTRAYESNELSLDGKVLYVSSFVKNDSTYLLQYNLDATNIALSRDTIWTQAFPINASGALKRGPDNKIYFACAYVTFTNGGYPYEDSLYNMYNMNLSVINSPDSLGAACNFTPYSFYLGGKRTYWGLPNNPDYDLGPLVGSPCDTLSVNLTPGPSPVGEGSLFLTYISAWEKLFINASGLRGKQLTATIYDATGKEKLARGKPPGGGLGVFGGHFTLDVDCTGWPSGLYIVHLQTEKEVLSKKFVKE